SLACWLRRTALAHVRDHHQRCQKRYKFRATGRGGRARVPCRQWTVSNAGAHACQGEVLPVGYPFQTPRDDPPDHIALITDGIMYSPQSGEFDEGPQRGPTPREKGL